MDKYYQIKIYWNDWTYKRTINPMTIMSDIFFQSQINGGQWEFKVRLSLPMNYDWVSNSDVVKLFCYDKDNTEGRLIYTWIVSRIWRYLEADGEKIELICVWFSALLSKIFFKDAVEWYEFTKNTRPSPNNKRRDWLFQQRLHGLTIFLLKRW